MVLGSEVLRSRVKGQTNEGGSCIIATDGRVVAGPLGNEEAILYADLDLNETLRTGQLLDCVGHYAPASALPGRVRTLVLAAGDGATGKLGPCKPTL